MKKIIINAIMKKIKKLIYFSD